MAIVTGSTTTYGVGTAGGNREDLEDVIWDLFAEETWALTNLDKVEATGTFHEWTKDELAAAGANIAIEGNSESYTTLVAPTRIGNYCQISDKLFLVSRTQEKIAKAGRTSEIRRAAMKKMLELKNDMEFALVTNQASSAGGDSTGRSSAGMESWIATNEVLATTTSSATTPAYAAGVQGAATVGTTFGAMTENSFKAALQAAWSVGGRTTIILTGASQKSAIDGFAGIVTKNIDMSIGEARQAAIVGAADLYVSSYGNHSIVLHRHVRAAVVMAIDPNYWAIAFIDRPFVEPYAKTSDGEKRHLASEYCLVSRNEKANAKVVGAA